MNCSLHNDTPASKSCELCGCAVCDYCLEQTAEIGQICVPCAIKLIDDEYRLVRKHYNWTIAKIVLMSIGWILGIITMICAIYLPEMHGLKYFLHMGIAIFFCGLPTAIASWRISVETYNAQIERQGTSYKKTGTKIEPDNNFSMNLFMAILGMFFGIILCPIQIIRHGLEIKKVKDTFPDYYDALQYLYEFQNQNNAAEIE